MELRYETYCHCFTFSFHFKLQHKISLLIYQLLHFFRLDFILPLIHNLKQGNSKLHRAKLHNHDVEVNYLLIYHP